MHVLHSTPKQSIQFEFHRVSTQNLGHVGPMGGCGGQLCGVPHQTKPILRKNSKCFQSFEAKLEGMQSISQ